MIRLQIPAAKDTWNLLKKRGIDALVNDSLVGMVLTTGAYIVGCAHPLRLGRISR